MALLNLRTFLTWTVSVVRSMLFDDYIYILPTLFGNWGRLFNPVEEKYRCISNKNMKYHPISWGVVYFFNRSRLSNAVHNQRTRKPGPLPFNPPFNFYVFIVSQLKVVVQHSLQFGYGRGEASLFHCHVVGKTYEKFSWGERSQNVLGVETCCRMAEVLPFSGQERA